MLSVICTPLDTGSLDAEQETAHQEALDLLTLDLTDPDYVEPYPGYVEEFAKYFNHLEGGSTYTPDAAAWGSSLDTTNLSIESLAKLTGVDDLVITEAEETQISTDDSTAVDAEYDETGLADEELLNSLTVDVSSAYDEARLLLANAQDSETLVKPYDDLPTDRPTTPGYDNFDASYSSARLGGASYKLGFSLFGGVY